MIRTLLAAPLLFILVLFALSNPQPVTLGIWPTDFTWTLPMSVAILLSMAAAFVLGAFLLWLGVVGARARARRAERAVRRLEEQARELKARLATASASAEIHSRPPLRPAGLAAQPAAPVLMGPAPTR